jgi:hypothetical protein
MDKDKNVLDSIFKFISELREFFDSSAEDKLLVYDYIELFVTNLLLQYLYDIVYLKTIVENMTTSEMIESAKEIANKRVQELKKTLGLDDDLVDGEFQYLLNEHDVQNIRLLLMVEYLLKELGKDPEEMNLYIGQRMKELGIKFIPIDQLGNINKNWDDDDDNISDDDE